MTAPQTFEKLQQKLKDLRLLIVEDHAPLRLALAQLFEAAGARVDFAQNAAQGLALVLSQMPHIVVLDLGLPGRDGIWLAQQIRAQAGRHVPILMLTARDLIGDKLLGFEAGADDYLTKPFDNAELLARCAALSMRHRAGQDHVLKIGSLSIDRRLMRVQRFGQLVELNLRAKQILLLLADRYPQPVTRSELIAQLWPDEPPPSDPLRSHLYLLRSALAQAAAGSNQASACASKEIIKTIQNVGFCLQDDSILDG
jgi:DNA-binding response OmpR family regulator